MSKWPWPRRWAPSWRTTTPAAVPNRRAATRRLSPPSAAGERHGQRWAAPTATGEDLGRMWEAATAQAATGDQGAVEALEVLKRQVYERWGLGVDQDGTVVDHGGKEPSLKRSASSVSAPVGQQAPAARMGAAIDSASDARTTASPVLPGTIEALLSSAHPLGPGEDLVAALAERGGDASAEVRRLATAQAVEVGADTGLG